MLQLKWYGALLYDRFFLHSYIYVLFIQKIKSMGGVPKLRMAIQNKAGPVVTDSGNFIIDAVFGPITDPLTLHKSLIEIPGVVETGLFCGMAGWAYIGGNDGYVAIYISLQIPKFFMNYLFYS